MKIPQDENFREQRRRYRLQFTCENCSLFDDKTEKCAHGYPTGEHRDKHYEDDNALLVFCKHYEMC